MVSFNTKKVKNRNKYLMYVYSKSANLRHPSYFLTKVNLFFSKTLLQQMQQDLLIHLRNFNSSRASIAKVRRSKYCRFYPTLLVLHDGSTITIRYHEPRHIIKMPLCLEDLSNEKERKRWQLRRKPVDKIHADDDLADIGFDSRKYLDLMKKKNSLIH